jgi:hypothetical protein
VHFDLSCPKLRRAREQRARSNESHLERLQGVGSVGYLINRLWQPGDPERASPLPLADANGGSDLDIDLSPTAGGWNPDVPPVRDALPERWRRGPR